MGKHIGTARIVISVNEIKKVQDNDVLVSIMTEPVYLPAIIRAGAVVTEEGGLLSHAAIVSRELGKPCIIGTGMATKVFRDGDLLEVDATGTKGIVSLKKRVSLGEVDR
jgi:pyruvate,water dikinase